MVLPSIARLLARFAARNRIDADGEAGHGEGKARAAAGLAGTPCPTTRFGLGTHRGSSRRCPAVGRACAAAHTALRARSRFTRSLPAWPAVGMAPEAAAGRPVVSGPRPRPRPGRG